MCVHLRMGGRRREELFPAALPLLTGLAEQGGMTLSRAAEATGIPKVTVYRWAREQRFPVYKGGDSFFVNVNQLLAIRGRPKGEPLPEPVTDFAYNARTLCALRMRWSSAAAAFWQCGAEEQAAAHAVCAFFAGVVLCARECVPEKKSVARAPAE